MPSYDITLVDFLDSLEDPALLLHHTPTESALPIVVHSNDAARCLVVPSAVLTDTVSASESAALTLKTLLDIVNPTQKLQQWLSHIPTNPSTTKFEGTISLAPESASPATISSRKITFKSTRIKQTDYYVLTGKLSEVVEFSGRKSLEFTLSGGGQTGEMLRNYDWANTPLGPISQWPQSLLSMVSTIMASGLPMALWWGQDLTLIYGDSYIECAGQKHPSLFGKTGKEGWAELWPDIEALARRAMAGHTCYMEDQMLPMFRHGFEEETYFTWSYVPIRIEDGSIGGLLNPNIETTSRVLAERGLMTLRNLATATATARSTKETCTTAIETLANNPKDIPYAILYTCTEHPGPNGEGTIIRLTLQDTLGVVRGTKAAPEEVLIEPDGTMSPEVTWPFDEAYRVGTMVEVDNPTAFMGTEIPTRGWRDQSRQAVVCPITTLSDNRHLGCLVMGLSPRRMYDERYRTFIELLSGQLSSALVAARGYQEEVKRAEDLAALDRAKTAFFSSISHELRTPLTLMLGPLDEALTDNVEPLTSNNRVRLSMVLRNAQRLLKLVNSLLDYSKIEAGRVQASFRQTNIGRLTTDLASVFRSAVEKGGVQYKVDCHDDMPKIWCDRDMWEKIVFNLIGNAFKFTLSGQITVTLRASDDEQWAEFSVKDSGVGIPPNEIQRIFERFHRVEGQRGRSFEGTGIGLSLTNELVKLHGGVIDVQSDGTGSTFRVRMPFGNAHLPQDRLIISDNPDDEKDMDLTYGLSLVDEARRWLPSDDDEASSVSAESTSSTNQDAVMASSGMKILLADDNRDMRRYVTNILRRWWQVTEARDGMEAVEHLRKESFDLVVSDIMMPNLDGFGLLKYIRSRHETRLMPVVLLSARAGDEARVDGLNAGADDYLMKPFSAKELVARVRTHLELGKLRMELEQRVEDRTRELGESERRFKVLADLSPVGIFRTDAEGRFTFVNDKWWEISGHDRKSDPDGNDFLRSVHDEDRARVTSVWGASVANGVPCNIEFRWKDDGKQERWSLGEAILQLDDEGNHIGFIGAVTDITPRKMFERETIRAAELSEQQQRQRAEEAEEIRRQQELFIDMICHELRNPLNGIYNNADLLNERLETMQKDLDNLQTFINKSDDGKKAETLTQMFNYMKTELAHDLEAVDMISLCAKHQKQIADDVLHMSKISMNLLVLAHIDYQPQIEIRNILKMFETEVATKQISLQLHFTNNFQKLNIDTVRGDPTRLAQVLINFLTNAIRFTEKVPIQRNIIVTVDVSLTRPPAKPNVAFPRDSPSPSEPVSAGHCSDDEDDTWSTISTHTITLRQSRATKDRDGGGSTMSSEDDHRPPSSEASLASAADDPERSESDGVYLVISIRDSGVGMTLEEQRQLFRRFTQASPKTYAEFGGSGLGLFISKKLVELQHGDIMVESMKGQGTTFTFYIWSEKVMREGSSIEGGGDESYPPIETVSAIQLVATPTVQTPLSAETPVSAQTPVSAASTYSQTSLNSPASTISSTVSPAISSTGNKIYDRKLQLLLVEDNVINQKVLKRQLELLGYGVQVANHGAEALTFLESSFHAGNESPDAPIYDLILMDLEMPVMDGLECTLQIRDWEATGRLSRRVPIIAVSGNARQEYVTRAMDAGMDDFVTKPYSKKVLEEKITKHVSA